MFDMVVRGGSVVDGTGSEPRRFDVGVVGDTIAAVEPALGPGSVEIDAEGLLVTPGFIDAHSHLDGSVTWESRMAPNSGHGITTSVMGNCGVGFAPCRPEHRAFTIDLMEGVEDIPGDVLRQGLPWAWESYPEYRAFLSERSFDMNIAGLVPHSSLRVDAMGVERALSGESATVAELALMQEVAAEALSSGAIGIGSTQLHGQKTLDGRPSPSRFADEREYLALAETLVGAGRGVLQIAPEFNQFPGALDELAMIIRVAESTGIRVTYTLKQTNAHPDGWRQLLGLTEDANQRGIDIRPQVLGRPTGAISGWESTRHRFTRCPSYLELEALPLDERFLELSRPEIREAILTEATATDPYKKLVHLMFPIVGRPDYEPLLSDSISAQAESSGMEPAQLIYDAYMADSGRGTILVTSGNYAEGNLDHAHEMLSYEHAVPGLGDAGAHCSVICDASATTSTLAYWTRDRVRGERFSVPFIVKRLTADPADLFGFDDRGRISVGAKADLNVIDYERLSLEPPRMTYDLPGGGKRLVQDANGYVATLVNGVVVRRHDDPTEALPGRLI